LAKLIEAKAPHLPPAAVAFIAFAGALGVTWIALHPLIAQWFLVYQKTAAYFGVVELVGLACYVRRFGDGGPRWCYAAGLAAGLGLLVRPTGVFYLGAWGIAFAVLAGGRRDLGRFVAGALPGIAAWMTFNHLRSGSLLSSGFENSCAPHLESYLSLRFGSPCVDALGGILEVAGALFTAMFVGAPAITGHLARCKFVIEDVEVTPFINPVVGILALCAAAFLLTRRSTRHLTIGPVAGLLAIFAAYVYAGIGLAERYAVDLKPLLAFILVLAGVTLLPQLSASAAVRSAALILLAVLLD
jgi:hypothetical protein